MKLRGVLGWVGLAAGLAACAGPTQRPDPTLADRVPAEWPHPLTAPATSAPQGMVVTDAPIASQVGTDILRAGGNAVDAAVATAFALAVVYPEAGNIGGGGFLVLRQADGTTAALDFRETAPAASTRDMFLDENGELTDRSVVGHLASGVPGAVAGLWEAHQKFGTLPWAELVAPAIRLAEEGFIVDEDLAGSVVDARRLLERFPASAELFLPGGEPIQAGQTWRNPDLAKVLRRIAEEGPDGFYRGETADLIVAEMERGGGIITHEDLRDYRALWREPIEFEYRGHSIVSMPPASSGGITLALIAHMLEPYDLGALGWNSPESMHLIAEAMRRAFADRNHYLGDPDFVEIPREMLLSREYAARRGADIDPERATPSSLVSVAFGDDGRESEHTTHFSVVDREGNAVALTTTINSLYGSGVTVAGAGFVLNNEMDDFAAKPGEPNQFGLVQGEANAVEPGKRMLSAMTPTIVTRPDGQVLLVTGARGGPRIITAVFQIISNVVDHGMGISAAINAPRIHHQHLPDVLYFERNGLTGELVRGLEAKGHTVQPRGGYIGNAPSILWTGDGWSAAADPRQGGTAEGH